MDSFAKLVNLSMRAVVVRYESGCALWLISRPHVTQTHREDLGELRLHKEESKTIFLLSVGTTVLPMSANFLSSKIINPYFTE